MLRIEGLREEATKQSRRASRWLERRRKFDASEPRRPVFVVGCQRSGTNMVMATLERAPDVWVHHEHRLSTAFVDYRLRETETIERLIARSPTPVVVFKPICDSHLTDRLLARHAGAKAAWIYRHWGDVANSNARNFGEHVRDILRWIVEGDSDWLGWRGERLGPEAVSFVREVYRPEMPLEEAGCVFWWLRNQFFFALGLERDARVRLVRYEDLVGGPDGFRGVFDFVGCRFDPSFLGEVFSTSIGKNELPPVAAPVESACNALLARLDAAYAAGGAPSS